MSYSIRPQLDSGALVAALLLARLNLQNRATCYLFNSDLELTEVLTTIKGYKMEVFKYL